MKKLTSMDAPFHNAFEVDGNPRKMLKAYTYLIMRVPKSKRLDVEPTKFCFSDSNYMSNICGHTVSYRNEPHAHDKDDSVGKTNEFFIDDWWLQYVTYGFMNLNWSISLFLFIGGMVSVPFLGFGTFVLCTFFSISFCLCELMRYSLSATIFFRRSIYKRINNRVDKLKNRIYKKNKLIVDYHISRSPNGYKSVDDLSYFDLKEIINSYE